MATSLPQFERVSLYRMILWVWFEVVRADASKSSDFLIVPKDLPKQSELDLLGSAGVSLDLVARPNLAGLTARENEVLG